MSPKWLLAIPLLPKVIACAALLLIGVAYAQSPATAPGTSVDIFAELWAMAKAAGFIGTATCGYLLKVVLNQRDKERAEFAVQIERERTEHFTEREKDRKELSRLQSERDSMYERSLTALINLDTTMEAQTRVTTEMVESNRALIDWLKDRDRMAVEARGRRT